MNQHLQRLLVLASAVVVAGLGACAKTPEVAATSPSAASAAANVSDGDVTEHVMTRLHQTESLRGADIKVVTINGDIRLTGVLDSQAQIDDALRIARAAEGAHAIHDELTVKK